jgi:hypothetical protein
VEPTRARPRQKRKKLHSRASRVFDDAIDATTPSTLLFSHRDYKVEQLVKSGNLEGAAAASAANAKA